MTWKAHGPYAEPGDDPQAPYHDAHQLAIATEHVLAAALGIVWGDYVNAVDETTKSWSKE